MHQCTGSKHDFFCLFINDVQNKQLCGNILSSGRCFISLKGVQWITRPIVEIELNASAINKQSCMAKLLLCALSVITARDVCKHDFSNGWLTHSKSFPQSCLIGYLTRAIAHKAQRPCLTVIEINASVACLLLFP